MTNVEGVLDKDKKLIDEISSSEILKMIEDNTITEGMIPKINTWLDAVNNILTMAQQVFIMKRTTVKTVT